MSYQMFIDDERFPPKGDWVICRNMRDVQREVSDRGFPSYVSFDHDLGENEPTGYAIALWMVDQDLDHNWMLDDWTFYVHSQNPIGKRNIEQLLNGYIGFKKALT